MRGTNISQGSLVMLLKFLLSSGQGCRHLDHNQACGHQQQAFVDINIPVRNYLRFSILGPLPSGHNFLAYPSIRNQKMIKPVGGKCASLGQDASETKPSSIRTSQMTGSDAWFWDSVLACLLQHLGLHSIPGSRGMQVALGGGVAYQPFGVSGVLLFSLPPRLFSFTV